MWVGKAALHCYYYASHNRTSRSDLPDTSAPPGELQHLEIWDLPREQSSEGDLHTFQCQESIAIHTDRTGGPGEESPVYCCTLGIMRRARGTYEHTLYIIQLVPAHSSTSLLTNKCSVWSTENTSVARKGENLFFWTGISTW